MSRLMVSSCACAGALVGLSLFAETIPSLPERTDEGYETSPYVVNGAEGPLVEVKRLSGAATLPVQETSGATYRIVTDGTANEFHYDGGTWNLYNPFGTLSNCQLNFAGGSGANQTANRIYVHGGAITGGRMQFVAAAEENLLSFDGGQHVFNGGVGFVSSSRSGSGLTPRTYTVEVSGADTSVSTKNWIYLVSNDNNGPTSGHAQDTLLIRVKDGGTFETTESIIDRGSAHYRYEVSNGGTLKMSGCAYIGYGSGHPAEIVVNDATFSAGSNWMGREDVVTLAATNSTIGIGGYASGTRLTCDFKDCTISTLGTLYNKVVASGGSIGGLTVAGNGRAALSDLTLKGQSCISANGTDAQLFLTNVTVGTGFYLGYVGCGAGKVGTVTFSGGTYLNEYYEFSIASGDATSVGTVNFEGGDYTFKYMEAKYEPRNTFHIGIDGTGTFNMRGGTVTGYSPILAENAGSTGILNLDGGTWYVKGLRVGAGTSVLNGDGGTLVPRVANASFISGLTTATVGAKGLLIDTGTTGFALTIPQAFANKAGTDAGVLRLKGASPITLTGSSTCAKIRLEGGSHVLSVSQGSAVEVIGGGRLNFADGAANAVTLGGLVLGESASAGVLAVEANDAITVTGALDFPNAFVALCGTFDLGEHVLVRTTSASLTPAVRTAWSRTSVAEGAVEGLVYRFTTKVVDDVEVLTVVIEEKKELGGNVNWQGGGDWSSDASWQGGKRPSDTEIATFVEGAPKSVTISAPVTVGALSFNANGYTVSGEGSIALSPAVSGSVTAAGGANEVAVGVSFSGEYPITVDEDAKLVLSGPLTGGLPVKRGAGELELSGENSFSGGIRAEAGKVTVVGAEAFGYNGAAPANDITLAGGELVYRGDAAGETTAASLAPAQTGTDVSRVTVETPLVTGAYAPVSGTFEKRGAANLTLGAVNARELTPGSGNITVTEGTLTLKGTTSDTMTLAKKILVGDANVEASATPELVLDGLRINNGATVGTITVADKAALTMTNGAVAYIQEVTVASTNTVSIDASILLGIQTMYLGSATKTVPMVLRVTNKGRISTYNDGVPASWLGALDAIFDDSILTRTSREKKHDFDYDFFPVFMQAGGSAAGTILFRNKSEFACRGLGRSCYYKSVPGSAHGYENPYYTNAVTVAFDDAVLSCAHYTLDFAVPHPQSYVTEVREGGLTIDLISCNGATIHKALTGVGGITVTGTGKTLVFDREMDRLTGDNWSTFFYLEGDHPTYCCEGVLKVESGVTVKLMAGSIRADAKVELAAGATLDLDGQTIELGEIAGSGRVVNGTLKVKTIKYDENGGVTLGSNAALASGTVKLDFARTSADPLDFKGKVFKILSYEGTAPAVTLKPINTGCGGLAATAVAAGGELKATLVKKGFALIVR